MNSPETCGECVYMNPEHPLRRPNGAECGHARSRGRGLLAVLFGRNRRVDESAPPPSWCPGGMTWEERDRLDEEEAAAWSADDE